jgi:transposase-like protein
LAGLQNINWLLLLHGWFWLIEILQVKYLNNMIEQDHRFIKKLTRPMKGFKSFQSALACASTRDRATVHSGSSCRFGRVRRASTPQPDLIFM